MFLLIPLVLCAILFVLACFKNRPWMWNTMLVMEIVGLIGAVGSWIYYDHFAPRSGCIMFAYFAESICAIVSSIGFSVILVISLIVRARKYVPEDCPEYI